MSILGVRHQLPAHMRLQRAFQSRRPAHAYIFYGPEGVGKTTLARAFSRLLLCQRPHETDQGALPPEYTPQAARWLEACNACESCRLAEAGTHPCDHRIHRQLIQFHPDQTVRNRKGLELGIDVIRQFVIQPAGTKPAIGDCKVFCIEEAHKLTIPAQNALLKTLEEPPLGTHLILISDSLDRLLLTVRSRCQVIPFHLLPSPFVSERLRHLRSDLSDAQVQYFAHHEPGSIGLALQWIDDGLGEHQAFLGQSLAALEPAQTLTLAKQIEERAAALGKRIKARMPDTSDSDAQRQALRSLLLMMATFYRDRLRSNCQDHAVVADSGSTPEATGPSRDPSDPAVRRGLAEAIGLIAGATQQLNLNINQRLCLENCLIQLARLFHQVS